MTQKTIIFDFDGTLADTLEILLSIYNDAAPKFSMQQIEKSDIKTLRDSSSSEIFKEYKVARYKVPLVALYIKRELAKHLTEIEMHKGIPELISELKSKGYRLGILTSNSAVNVLEYLKQQGLDEDFEFVYGSRRIFGKDKALNKIMAKHGLNNDDVIYVGDEVRDVTASKKAKVKIIAVTWGFNSKDKLLKTQPTYLVDKPKDILLKLQAN